VQDQAISNGPKGQDAALARGMVLAAVEAMLRAISVASVALTPALALAASPAAAVTVSASYLVKQIDSELTDTKAVCDTLFFVTERPWVLWKSDGTAAGTLPVEDVDEDYELSSPPLPPLQLREI
jgi:ELWxxDGT repeat protein